MIRVTSLPCLALLLVSLALAISAADPPKGTSFDFEGIKYTFYPSQPARTWEQGKAFCDSQKQELAQFQKRSQLNSISEYLSEQGGVWTAYFTDGDAIPQAINEAGPAPWNADLPMRSNGRPSYPDDSNKCGLLQVTKNDTGIVPTDCSTRKAALCCDVSGVNGIKSANVSSLANNSTAPLASKAVQSNRSSLPAIFGTPSTGLAVNASSPVSIPDNKAVQTSVAEISKSKAAVASNPDEGMDEVTAAAAAVTAAKKRLAAAVANAAHSAPPKSAPALPKAAEETSPALPKAAEETSPALPKAAEETAPTLSKAAVKPALALPKAAAESTSVPTKTKKNLTPAPATETPVADSSKNSAKASPGAFAPSEKAKATKSSSASIDSSDPSVSLQHGSEDSVEDLSLVEDDAGEVEHTGSKMLSLPDQAAPVKFTIMGTQFFYFKDVLHFGGWFQARAFCREHDMELATFLNRDQLMKVATRVSGDPVWTGYYTDGSGAMLSSDEAHAPWKIAFAMAGIPSNQPNMCGMLSVLLGKNVGVWPHACAAPRTTLCSIHNGPAKKKKHPLKLAAIAKSKSNSNINSNSNSSAVAEVANKNSTVVA